MSPNEFASIFFPRNMRANLFDTKSTFNQKKEPYAKLNDIRLENSSSEGGTSSISHADKSAPAISLESRGDDKLFPDSDGYLTEAQNKSEGPDLVSTSDKVSSGGKVNTLSTEEQISGEESSSQLADDKGAGLEQASVQAAVEAASAEVDTNPTEAQKEAGNYKKGHVTIGDFDITIDNPAGSVRSGVNKETGEKWETKMANAYGYILNTESADGDHIDVFLAEDMDWWDARRVFVIDQTKEDGSFDEHKVMLGFNDGHDAMRAYLANYDAAWAEKHPGLRISEVNIEDFNKWIQSSHRKTKPFADYRNIKALTEEVGQTRTHINDEGVIVDGDGKPMTLYHGTPNDIESVTDLETGHKRESISLQDIILTKW